MTAGRLSLLALFIAISVLGGFIKIPAIVGSIALDLFPALMAAIYLGRNSGALVGAFGHLASAMIGGLSLGPLHLLIALFMAIIVYFFEILYTKTLSLIAGLFVLIANTLLAPLPMIYFFSSKFYIALLPPLFVGSLVNIAIALLLIPWFRPIFERISK